MKFNKKIENVFDLSTNRNIAITVPFGFDLTGFSSRFSEEFPRLVRGLSQGKNGEYILDMNHPLVRQFISEKIEKFFDQFDSSMNRNIAIPAIKERTRN